MADYHTTYKGPEGQTTQWDDIQVKLGNIAPRSPKHKPPKYEGEKQVVKDADWVCAQDADNLSEHEDDFADDRALENVRYAVACWACVLVCCAQIMNCLASSDPNPVWCHSGFADLTPQLGPGVNRAPRQRECSAHAVELSHAPAHACAHMAAAT